MSHAALTSCLIILLAFAGPARADDTAALRPSLTYRITGVAAADRLNVRAEPDAGAPIVGAFLPDARNIVVTGAQRNVAGSVWWEVAVGSTRDATGWVNARFLTPEITEAAAPRPSLTYRITGVAAADRLNVRAEPDAGAPIVGAFLPDARNIVVTGAQRNVAGSVWWEVAVGSTRDATGWVNARFLTPEITEAAAPRPSLTYRITGVAAADRLNVRAEPDAGAPIVGAFLPDARNIVVTGAQRNVAGSVWWEVAVGRAANLTGWVNARFLTPEGLVELARTGPLAGPHGYTVEDPAGRLVERTNRDGTFAYFNPFDDPIAILATRLPPSAALTAAVLHSLVIAAIDRGDYEEALRVLRPLADRGDPISRYNLGFLYSMGQGVPLDFYEAAKWFELSADQGFAPAQIALGLMFVRGTGVPLDLIHAHKWFSLAIEDRPEPIVSAASNAPSITKDPDWLRDTRLNLARIASQMTSDQIVDAQRLAREWKSVAER